MQDFLDYEAIGGPEGLDEYVVYLAQCKAEQEAERAWLYAAEAPIDDGFEQWEMDRGCWMDPQSGYPSPC